MDPASPFAKLAESPKPISPSGIVHVNFCDACHYVWKAPAPAETCINCKGNGKSARSLVSYRTEAPRI